MKKIAFVIFAVLCMITVSCNIEFPDEMSIKDGNVTVDNFPPQYQTFPAPAYVQLGSLPSSTFTLTFRLVPNAWKYEYYMKLGNEKYAQIRSLFPSDYLGGVDNDLYPTFTVTCNKSDIKDEIGPLVTGNPVFFGIAAIAPNGTASEIRWSQQYSFW